MKKVYTKPTAEKLAFHYRDQVVAASGDVTGTGNDQTTGEQIIERIAQGLGVSLCDNYECSIWANG